MILGRAEIEEGEAGTLSSLSFGDIYFSPEDGLAESQFVFIDGNDLGPRMERAERPMVIGELGFGTGLNILALLREHDRVLGGPLDIWSCEGFPLSRDDFQRVQGRIADRWPEIAPYAERLAAVYPDPVPGQVHLVIDRGITLTLAFGPVKDMLDNAWFEADAWFLDGFAPSKNPEMWTSDVMTKIAGLSKPGATAATFSVASGVRQALERAGFSWRKTPGFARKKHMLRAQLERPTARSEEKPWFAPPRPASGGRIAIIGAGIAGCMLARALDQRERDVILFDGAGTAAGASGNPAGLVMPRLDADRSPAACFYRDAFLFAIATYRDLPEGIFSPCGGTVALEGSKRDGVLASGLWPRPALEALPDGLRIPDAGVLVPSEACRALNPCKVLERKIGSVEEDEEGWILTGCGETFGPFAAVVITTGAEQILWPASPIKPSLGQVDVFTGPAPGEVVTDGSYVAPLGHLLVAGATYAPFGGGEITPSEDRTEANRRAAEALLGGSVGAAHAARAALRATTPDRHPVAGPLHDHHRAISVYEGLRKGRPGPYPPTPYRRGLFVLTGLGSRGLVTAPILAEHVAAEITGGVSPLTQAEAELVHPMRFFIRDLKRGKVSP